MAIDTEKGNTPIADAFAHNRAVLADAMALIRKLERDRAELAQMLLGTKGYSSAEIRERFPLDKVELT